MKRIKNKKIIFIIIFILVISSTIAFLYSSNVFENIFVAASYKVIVTENFESPDNWKPGDTTPKEIFLKNEGTVPIKVRISYTEEWRDANNNLLDLVHNGERVAIINFANQDDYVYRDGYYYYDPALNPGETTSSFIESVTFNPNYEGSIVCDTVNGNVVCESTDDSYDGATYKLTITIEGVQEEYYVQAWNLPGIIRHNYLYYVLQDEVENNGVALKYTGSHHDSFTEEPSKDIYYWYASNNNGTAASQVLDKNNVIFAGHCWQMIRTTDTGGVKMMYNGEAENNQCLNTRENHIGYASRSSISLSSNYWYGTDYTYDTDNNVFSISGTTEQATWNATTGPSLIGKYTCMLGNEDGTCSTLYLIESYKNTSSAYALLLNFNSHYSQFGSLPFNPDSISPTYVGYMYGDIYNKSYTGIVASKSFQSTSHLFLEQTLNTDYWYADDVSYDSSTNTYSLINPYQISSSDNFPSLAGKYTFNNSSQTYTANNVKYIAGVNNSVAYVIQNNNGQKGANYYMAFGDSITDNGNNTYTINNPQNISLINWYNNYSTYSNKYVCVNSSTCSDPVLLTSATYPTDYFYIPASEKILISKSRNGLNLIDTLSIRKDEWYFNYNSYSDYKYTCDNLQCM